MPYFLLSCHEKAHDNKELSQENPKPSCESQSQPVKSNPVRR